MREYKDYIKSETDKNGVLWYWIDEPIFTAIDFKQDIENNYNHLLKRRVKSDLNNELEIEIIKEVIQDFEQAKNLKPTYDCNKLLFPEKCFGGWFSDDTIEEFKRYFAEYSDYKYLEFFNEFLKNRLNEIENGTIPNNVISISNTKPKKVPEKWHALHYWFELMAHGKKPPYDLGGGFVKSELEKEGVQRCNSKGQKFYKDFSNIDINDSIKIKRVFGENWKEVVLQLSKNDDVTTFYINEKYN